MMKKSKFLVCAVLLLASLFAVSCEDEESDPIIVRIFCYGSSFSGWYIIDGESPVFFSNDVVENGVYFKEIEIDELDELEMEVVTSTIDATSLAIKIYRDDTKVKESSQTGSSSIIMLNFTYTFGENEDDSSS